MKCYNYTDLGIISAKKPFNTHLFWEHSTYGLILVDADDQTKLFISTDKGDNWSEIDLSDNANSYKIQSGCLDGNNLWLLMCDNDGTADNFEVCYIELDDSNDCNPIGVSSGADANSVYAYDIWVYDGNTYAFTKRDVGGAGWVRMIVWDVDTHPFTLKDKVVDGSVSGDYDKGSFGAVVGDNIYFTSYINSSSSLILYYYDHSATDLVQRNYQTGYDLPDRNQQSMAYNGDDLIYFISKKDADSKDYLIAYSITGNSYTILGEYNIALMLDRNTASGVMEKAFHITEYKVYQLHPENPYQLYLISYVTTDAVIIAITDNYLMNNDGDMFEYEDISTIISDCVISLKYMETPSCTLILSKTYPIVAEMYMIIIDMFTTATVSASGTIFEGFVESFDDKPMQTVILRSPATRDLDEIFPSGDYSGRSDEIIVSLLSAYSNYITAGTMSNGIAMGTITFSGDKSLRELLKEFALTDKFIWYITPEGKLYYNSGAVDSGVNFSETSNIWGVRKTAGERAINYVNIKGGIVAGAQVSGTVAENIPNQQLYGKNPLQRTFSHLDLAAQCTTTNTNILSRYGTQPNLVFFSHLDATIGVIQPGETITFQYNRNTPNITSDQFSIKEVLYNAKDGKARYGISDQLL